MINESLYNAFISQINYGHYLEGTTDKVEGKIDYELLRAIYAGFLYTVLFDDYFEKKNGQITTKLTDSFIDRLISLIATQNEEGYTFGQPVINLGYETKELALDKLRNKIAHGDFFIRDGNIVFQEKNHEAVVNINNFIKMVIGLETYADIYKKDEPGEYLLYIQRNLPEPLSKRNINDLSKEIYQLKIVDKPLPGKIRDDDYVGNLYVIDGYIEDYVRKYCALPIEKHKKILDKNLKKYSEKYNMDLSYTIVPINELPEYNEIKEKFFNKRKRLFDRGMPITTVIDKNLLCHTIFEVENDNKLDIRKSINFNLAILNYLKEDPSLVTEALFKVDASNSKICFLKQDEILITTYLVAFYSLFHYGLETLYTTQNERKLYDVYNYTKLNFSKLDVSVLDTPTRVNEKEALGLDYDKEKEGSVNSVINKYNTLRNAYIKVADNNGETSEKAVTLRNKANNAAVELFYASTLLINDMNNYDDFMSNFDFDKYINNLDIIYHVRNAIAHGNVKIARYGKDIMDTVIHIVDRKDGRTGAVVYDKEITAREFVQIFKGSNVEILLNFLMENMKGSEIIDPNIFNELSKKIERK